LSKTERRSIKKIEIAKVKREMLFGSSLANENGSLASSGEIDKEDWQNSWTQGSLRPETKTL
jgi:hypothetical protein